MLRMIIALPVGIVVMGLLVAFIESLGHTVFPASDEMKAAIELIVRQDPAARQAVIDAQPTMPIGAYLSVVAAWCLGAAGGAWTAARIAGTMHMAFGVGVGLVVLLSAAANLALIPHPVWMWPVGLVAPVLCALASARQAASGSVSRVQ